MSKRLSEAYSTFSPFVCRAGARAVYLSCEGQKSRYTRRWEQVGGQRGSKSNVMWESGSDWKKNEPATGVQLVYGELDCAIR